MAPWIEQGHHVDLTLSAVTHINNCQHYDSVLTMIRIAG